MYMDYRIKIENQKRILKSESKFKIEIEIWNSKSKTKIKIKKKLLTNEIRYDIV